MSLTLDANILLYASDVSSARQGPARRLVDKVAAGPEIAYVFWPTIMAYLRVATHPAVFDRPLSAGDAIANIEALLSRPHVRAPGEQPEFWRRYRLVADDALPTGNLVPDAHLVALMVENEVRTIWTHDRDFRRFKGIEVRDPFD
ncbi:MAG TPA: TA system VapC family ribonuclease toxin [Candidatus Limnocylindria bacterium]|nr:TA system VapC family ribonuclease toxin [Candidatus Limnocylindria bacterium]